MNAFDYRAPRTLDEALAILREHGEDARLREQLREQLPAARA